MLNLSLKPLRTVSKYTLTAPIHQCTSLYAVPSGPPLNLSVYVPPPLSSHNGIIQEYKLRVIEISTSSEIYYTSLSTKMTLDNLHQLCICLPFLIMQLHQVDHRMLKQCRSLLITLNYTGTLQIMNTRHCLLLYQCNTY